MFSEDLEALFTREYGNIARTIARIVRDPGRAEELAVEVFLQFSKASKAQSAVGNGLLYRRAVRLALDELRRRNRRDRLRHFFSFLAVHPDPEQEHIVRDRRVRVAAILERMRRRDAELLVLRAEGLSYHELGKALSINPASVGTLLCRAQQAFRKEYLKRYGQPD